MSLSKPRGRQSDVVYLKAAGHQVVLGTAGTGKTLMALFRALHLASPSTPGNGQVLLVTYNNALVTYLRHLKPAGTPLITVETFGRFARGYLNSMGQMRKWGGIATPNQKRSFVEAAIEQVGPRHSLPRLFSRDIGFFLDELQWLAGMGVDSLDEYQCATGSATAYA